MAHFAELSGSTVISVIVIADSDCDGGEFPSSEGIGQMFIASIGIVGVWKQTSYGSNFRARYAAVGGSYDLNRDEFVAPKPHLSWLLDENNNWQPPIPIPVGGESYAWYEANRSWEIIVPPVADEIAAL